MTAPQRIQRRRTRGWRMPAGAVYVGRPTRWGNPAIVVRPAGADRQWSTWETDTRKSTIHVSEEAARLEAVSFFRTGMNDPTWAHPLVQVDYRWMREHLAELQGRTLACWCKPDAPCHADVLLELANGVADA